MEDVLKYVLKYGTVVAVAYFITEAAMYFDKPGILWWYIVPLLIAGTNIDYNVNRGENNGDK